MPESLISIAVMEPLPGCEDEFLQTLRELYALMHRKNYSRNQLFSNRIEPKHYFNIRYWTSPEARNEAHEDPEVHRCWARLGNLCRMVRVHQTLDDLTLDFDKEPAVKG